MCSSRNLIVSYGYLFCAIMGVPFLQFWHLKYIFLLELGMHFLICPVVSLCRITGYQISGNIFATYYFCVWSTFSAVAGNTRTLLMLLVLLSTFSSCSVYLACAAGTFFFSCGLLRQQYTFFAVAESAAFGTILPVVYSLLAIMPGHIFAIQYHGISSGDLNTQDPSYSQSTYLFQCFFFSVFGPDYCALQE